MKEVFIAVFGIYVALHTQCLTQLSVVCAFLLGFLGEQGERGREKGRWCSCIMNGHREINSIFIESLEVDEVSQVSASINYLLLLFSLGNVFFERMESEFCLP